MLHWYYWGEKVVYGLGEGLCSVHVTVSVNSSVNQCLCYCYYAPIIQKSKYQVLGWN